jgi:hypothetical protein
MKYYLFLIVVCFTQPLFAQNNKGSIDIASTEFFPDCPAETCPAASLSIDEFSFHKPRTSCTSGFGLCLKVSLSITCLPCDLKSTLIDGKVNALIKIKGNEVAMRIPVDISHERDFEKTDFSTFEVEEGSIAITSQDGKRMFVQPGIYPVVIEDHEYVINMTCNP